jgi:hypothetical protein
MACLKLQVSVAADASHYLSVEYLVFKKKVAYESVGRPGAKSRFHTPHLHPLGICRLRGLNEQHFQKVEFWNREVAAVLGHSDFSSHSEQLAPEDCVESQDGIPAVFILQHVCSSA